MQRAQDLSPQNGYDLVARTLHWLTAALIATLLVLGLSMTRMSVTTEDQAAEALRLFSLHKTLGIATFGVALARLAWALGHPGPGPLHPGRTVETFAAEVTHWALYGALIVLPLSGWLHHSARPGFAPILWPLGQGLPFVPASEALANVFQTIHRLAGYALYAALSLHILGAFRHAILDMDATFLRMTAGLGPAVAKARRHALPAVAALALWAAVIALGVATAPPPPDDPFAGIDAGADPVTQTGAPSDEDAPAP